MKKNKSVIKLNYSVSLVYVNEKSSMLRHIVLSATDSDQALGAAIKYFSAETREHCLQMRSVINF